MAGEPKVVAIVAGELHAEGKARGAKAGHAPGRQADEGPGGLEGAAAGGEAPKANSVVWVLPRMTAPPDRIARPQAASIAGRWPA